METLQTSKNRLQLLGFLKEKLTASGIAEAEEESRRILEDVLGLATADLFIEPYQEVPRETEERALEIAAGRGRRVPLAYLLRRADFWNESLYVDERVLIPRPETEILVERIILEVTKSKTGLFGNGHEARIGNGKGNVTVTDKRNERRRRNRLTSFLDIGTGSGAIAIALLRELPEARATLLDISGKALEVARENIRKYDLIKRAKFIEGNLFSPFGPGEKWDLIVSNPPYLSEKDLENLQPEIKYEPEVALHGGKDGLDFYRKLISGATNRLNLGGMLAVEVGAGQAETVSKWLQDAGYDNIQRSKDYLGIDRVLTARFHPE